MFRSCHPIDCSLPGSSVHRILQAKTLEWVATSFSRGSSRSRNWTQVSGTAGSSLPTELLHFHFSLSYVGEGSGNPLQCSCLENPRDRGAWWAAIYGVAQSQTRLKWLSSSSSMTTRTQIVFRVCPTMYIKWRGWGLRCQQANPCGAVSIT